MCPPVCPSVNPSVSLHESLRVSCRLPLCIFLCMSLRVSFRVCPTLFPCVPPNVPPYVPPYLPPYVPSVCPSVSLSLCPSVISLYLCASVCLTFRYECSFLVTSLYISPCLSVLPSPSVCLCVPLRVPPVYPCELELQVWFSDLMYRFVWCSLARGASVPWEQQLQVDLFDLNHLPVLSIPQINVARGHVYVGAAAVGVVFRPNLLFSLMQFSLRTSVSWEYQLQVGLSDVIYLPVLSISQSYLVTVNGAAGQIWRPNVSISLEQFGLGRSAPWM